MTAVKVLTWNLFHGRSVPDVPRGLLREFSALLAGWPWDVALLQEVPPWWPPALGAAAGARSFTAPTSRNQLLWLTRPVAERRPDLVTAWGGGANAILVRGRSVTAHGRVRLRLCPERRVMDAVRRDDGIWFGNLHATAHDEHKAQEDLDKAAAVLRRWAGDEPAVIGGDCNTRTPRFPGFEHCGGHVLDHVFARGLECAGAARTLPRHEASVGANLSDHKPVIAELRVPART